MPNGSTFTNLETPRYFSAYFPYVGAGLTNQTAPYSTTTTTNLGSSVDWAGRLIAITGPAAGYVMAGDSVEASPAIFSPFTEQYFSGAIFAGGYVGIPWLKNCFMLTRDFWDSGAYSRSTPYSGQLFPVGSGQGTPGQIYPY